MKKNNQLFKFFTLIFASIFTFSCSSDDDKISSKQLLPSKMKESFVLTSMSYYVDVEIVEDYTYDETNRLINISETYSATNPNSKNITNTIVDYDTEGRISKAHITTSRNSAVGVVSVEKYSYEGDRILKNKDGKDVATIQVSKNKIIVTSLIEGETLATANYTLDNNGNVVEFSRLDDYKIRERYNYDRKNGIYKHVNTPNWFLITQVGFSGYQSENRTKELLFSDGKWNEYTYSELEYNNDDYPVSIKIHPAPYLMGISSSTKVINYIPAKTIAK